MNTFNLSLIRKEKGMSESSRPLSDEAFSRDLRELRLWLEGAEPVHGHQGWQHRTLNFYWMDKFRTLAKEVERRLPEQRGPTDAQLGPGTNTSKERPAE
jgi:hypothetical protein